MNPQSIQILTNLGSQATQAALAAYTQYFWRTDLLWMAFSLLLLIPARMLYKRAAQERDSEDKLPWWLACGVLVLIAVLTFFLQVDQLCQPNAIAIHQFLKDLTGK